MNRIDLYKSNRPLVNSIFSGLFYLLFCWSLDMAVSSTDLFIALMFFLPGITFPLATCYYNIEKSNNYPIQLLVHLFFSVGIYFGSVWLFSGEGRIKYITVLAGFVGSLFFLLMTKYVLKKRFSIIQILVSAVASGLAFLQYEILGRKGFYLGMAIFIWTVVNGLLLNYEYRKAKSLLHLSQNQSRM